MLTSVGAAADWPQFRGPTGQGLAKAQGLPISWGPEENVAWKAALPGQGWSSPVLHEGRVYVTAAVPAEGDGDAYSLSVLCLNGETGAMHWSTPVFSQDPGAPNIHKKNSHASPTPIVQDGRLYAHFGHQGTACLNLDGQVIWRNDRISYRPVHGNGGSPALVGDALIFSCDGGRDPFVIALDIRSGEVLWKTPRHTSPQRPFSFCTPLAIEVDGQTQVVLPGSDAVFAYDPKTGRPLWRADYPGGYSVVPRPVFGHGLVFVCTGFNRASLLAIRPIANHAAESIPNAEVVWDTSRAVPLTPSPLLVGDELYMVADSGVASCLDARTGKVHWQQRLDGGFSASPVYADGKIYLQSEGGVGYVLAADTRFKQLARNDLNERTLASYAIGDNALYIRTAKHFYCIKK